MTPVRLEPAASRSRVKHCTTEPLRSLWTYIGFKEVCALVTLTWRICVKVLFLKHFRAMSNDNVKLNEFGTSLHESWLTDGMSSGRTDKWTDSRTPIYSKQVINWLVDNKLLKNQVTREKRAKLPSMPRFNLVAMLSFD